MKVKGSVLLLPACVLAALVFRKFVFVAYYPVVMGLSVAAGFGFSLFRRKSLCEELAERMLAGVLPEGAAAYCRRLTILWCVLLIVNVGVAFATTLGPRWIWVVWNCALSYLLLGTFGAGEWWYRRRRFACVFQTSGSTARPKTIVKPFETLAREVAYHRTVLADALAEKPVFLATIEPQHMYGKLWRVLLPQAAGCVVDPEIILTPESLIAKMKSARKVFLVTTPSFLERVTAYAEQYEIPQNCVEITTSGALLTAEVSAATKRVFGLAPREIFGSTETGGVAWRRQGGGSSDWTVFDPVRVSTDAEGRLVVSSPFSMARRFTMGDGVEMAAGGRHFTLLGRRDRLVKIAEQRVLLPEREEEIKALPEVRDAALCPLEGSHGTFLGAVLVLADPRSQEGNLALAWRTKLLPLFPKGTVPRKFRFVRELPRNAQGKVQVGELRKILQSNLVEPIVEAVEESPTSWSAVLTFRPEAPYFKGHFPSFAVLPGVIQIGMAHHFAEQWLRRSVTLKGVKKMKFTRVIVPGEQIRFSLTRKSEQELVYDYRKGEQSCSSGVLCF